jgi:hypothetical protein
LINVIKKPLSPRALDLSLRETLASSAALSLRELLQLSLLGNLLLNFEAQE